MRMRISKCLSVLLVLSLTFFMGSTEVKASVIEDLVQHVNTGIPEILEELQFKWPDGCQRLDLAEQGYKSKATDICYYGCMGFAVNVYDELFKKFQEMEDSVYFEDAMEVEFDDMQVGDIVVYNETPEWDHAIVITKIDGDSIYYVDCNGDLSGDCIVRWNNHILKSTLKEKLNREVLRAKGEKGTIIQSSIVRVVRYFRDKI